LTMIHPGTIIFILFNCIIAVGLNVLINWTGLLDNGEVFALYFVLLAAKVQNSQYQFTKAYKENPQLVEQILRSQLLDE
jgi:hypothetical protein